MFYQILLSPQGKRSEIIIYKRGIYQLPHELPNDVRQLILRNWETPGKRLNFIKW